MNTIDRLTFTNPDARRAMEADARHLLSLALSAQGPAALACPRRAAALHEAGHVVMYLDHGRRVRSVKIFERDGFWLGMTRAAGRLYIDEWTHPLADLVEAKILLAGPFAELALSGSPALGAGVDELALARAIVGQASSKLDEDPEHLMTETLTEVLERLRDHRRALDEMAALLQRHRKLSGERVTAVLRRHASGYA
ncbi:hypothetical protein HW932_09650 [Allochromatium humboldtianum]|uniref:Peptidase M41 domain-containing protein n=1 Tax=Allochromatium humboldtianum TaxID=504901 RepID=A0A850RDX4_9GAMM|nr:hypothetical protein [Allochromatium humboldtianum]NVZ09527.1 hypothetical protein [Allochromatium humboldtianum]